MQRDTLRNLRMIATAGVLTAGAGTAQAVMIDFNTLQHGEIVTNQFAGQGVAISAINPNRPFDLAIIFDANQTGTADPDLEGPPWAGGNLAISNSAEDLQKMLILAENNIDIAPADGLIDSPDDELNRPAGDLIFDFAQRQTQFGFDIVDIEGVIEEFSSVEFFANNTSLGSVNFSAFTNIASIFFDSSVVFGNNHANRIAPIDIFDVNAQAGAFDKVVIHMGGSGAVDNINYVPTPGATAMLGLAGLAGLRRRR